MNIPAELRRHVDNWAQTHPLKPIHIDCATAVMLKILDGKCKMKPESMVVMQLLYDAVRQGKGKLLKDDIHTLISAARVCITEELAEVIYEKRLLAETMISRPVMKGYKAMIKAEGLFDSAAMVKLTVGE